MPGGVLPPRTIANALNVFLRRGTRSGFYWPDWPSVETLTEDAAEMFSSAEFYATEIICYTYCYPTEQSWLQSTSPAT